MCRLGNMLISVHVPKCAGTSFRGVLQEIYGPRIWLNYGCVFHKAKADPGLIPPNTSCIHGHFIADSFDELFPSRRYITWVRHPVERVVSNYYHFLRSPDMRDDCCRALFDRKLSLLQFAELPWMQNETTRYLANKPVEDFAFVGIVEKYQASLKVFSHDFCRDLDLPVLRENCNPGKSTDIYPLSREDYRRIAQLNTQDLQWYNQSCERLRQKYAIASSEKSLQLQEASEAGFEAERILRKVLSRSLSWLLHKAA